MSISRITLAGESINSETKLKWITLTTTLGLSVFMLSALDLFAALIRGSSLLNYAMYVLTDITLTVLGLVPCADLVVARGRKSVKFFLVCMLLSWAFITLIRLCQSLKG